MTSVRSFASARALAWLNVAAVGLALASCTSAVLHIVLTSMHAGPFTGLPTLFFGALWAWLLRLPKTFGPNSVRVGWLASVPLAVANSGVSCAIMFLSEPGGGEILAKLFGGFALGAIVGAFIWIPALVLTLLCFGLPIARAQRLAAQGLAGAERGEVTVGASCLVLSMLGILFSLATLGTPFAITTGLVGGIAGGTAWWLAARRERERTQFVARVERGEVADFRVEQVPEGKALVRLVPQRGVAYRVADFRAEVCMLDEEGRATTVRV
jgi:hypothetical protein